ncbi:DUF943 family protein [Paramixta manurensis]|uniref:DUF943 family protein n=1 Tax=Paramixta manurensis TaxID=2740817 RepID=A0A6M8U2Q8_9GAMM|nr:DUF943 family protein [Erwiniaceae bacterium PD-1]
MLVVCVCAIYAGWRLTKPVEVIGIHKYRNSTDILIKNSPLTAQGKISWWKEYSNQIAEENIAKPSNDGTYYINIWDFGSGYKENGKYDRLCFADIPSPKNCIDKVSDMVIYKFKQENPIYAIDGKRYTQLPSGKIVEEK